MLGHFFISYSRVDRAIARDFRRLLTELGAPTWIDDDLTPGTHGWEEKIRQALDRSIHVIAICSPNSADSGNVSDELRSARGKKLDIIPVWVDGSEWLNSAPYSLGGVQHIDARQPSQAVLEEIVKALTAPPTRAFAPVRDWATLYIRFNHKSTEVDLRKHTSVAMAFAQIYDELLQDDFAPYSYGEEWAIAFDRDRGSPWDPLHRVIWLPADWARRPFVALPPFERGWGQTSALIRPVISDQDLHVIDLRKLSRDAPSNSSSKLFFSHGASKSRRNEAAMCGLDLETRLAPLFLDNDTHPKSVVQHVVNRVHNTNASDKFFPSTRFEFVTAEARYYAGLATLSPSVRVVTEAL